MKWMDVEYQPLYDMSESQAQEHSIIHGFITYSIMLFKFMLGIKCSITKPSLIT